MCALFKGLGHACRRGPVHSGEQRRQSSSVIPLLYFMPGLVHYETVVVSCASQEGSHVQTQHVTEPQTLG